MSRTLYLHIGNHKTGSTSIQEALSQVVEPRVFKAVRPLATNDQRYQGWCGNTWVIKEGGTARTGAEISPFLLYELVSHNPQGEVVFSAEDLSWIFSKSQIDALAEGLKAVFDQVIVLIYLRRQDRNMISFYQEGLKWGSNRFLEFTGAGARSMPDYQPHFDLYFDYEKRIGLWADAFGWENIRAFDFDLVRKNENPLRHFARQTGLDFPDYEIVRRVSHSRERQLINLRLAENRLRADIPYGISRSFLAGEPMRPPRVRAKEFYAHFRDSNARLNERLKISDNVAIFDENFDEYSLDGNEGWDAETADRVVDFFIKVLNYEQGRARRLNKRIENLEKAEKNFNDPA